MAVCTHVDTIQILEPTGPRACGECVELGMQWVHLRLCTNCGRIGCCDSSPGRHASKHAAADGHLVMRSIEPGEDWFWCVVDEAMFRVAVD